MTTFFNPPCHWLPDSTDAENEIRGVFYHQWAKAKDQLTATVSTINAWRQKFIDDVNKYVNEQILDLTNDYDRQRLILDQTCEENLDTTRAYLAAQNVELFSELRSACRSLELQLARLEFINGTMPVPKVITVQEQMETKKKEQSDTSKPENDQSEEKLRIQRTNNIQDNPSENSDASVKSISSISNETQPQSSAVASSNDNGRPIDSDNNPQAHIVNDDSLINKCPICFMIFPLSMTQDCRSQHVNEHCTDD